ncbi:metal ABC transporter solute-binding protein, Zn/Mn family [Microbacterium sp. YY-01]|uniref:metal ABC transporter solute-binding protein, Zn/Mn family n=1 Tax=Microbacterium sp. YY-01 TaxID=3421634 RepID=UPI003D184BC7
MKRLPALATAALMLVVALTGCSVAESPTDDRVQVVASTVTYGDIASTLGGARVNVVSIVTSTAQDPHMYEATARDRLAVSQADLILANGGGYDAFMASLIDDTQTPVLAAADMVITDGSGSDDDLNEHVWYDLETIEEFAAAIAEQLSTVDPEGAEKYATNLAEFTDDIDTVRSRIDQLAATVSGAHVFLTEPLGGYLADSLGLNDVAPQGFAAAVEAGNDVAPALMKTALDTIAHGDVQAVLSNIQTRGPETVRMEQAATSASVPVVQLSELPPEDTDYIAWMTMVVDELEAALQQ